MSNDCDAILSKSPQNIPVDKSISQNKTVKRPLKKNPRILKKRNLETSIKASENMISIADKDQKMKQNYYSEKLEILKNYYDKKLKLQNEIVEIKRAKLNIMEKDIKVKGEIVDILHELI